MVAGAFVFWYGFLRIFTDLCRDHGAELFGIGRNQVFNIAMAVIGFGMMAIFAMRPSDSSADGATDAEDASKVENASWGRRAIFVLILLFCLVVRSAWTPEVLEEKRHHRTEQASIAIPMLRAS